MYYNQSRTYNTIHVHNTYINKYISLINKDKKYIVCKG